MGEFDGLSPQVVAALKSPQSGIGPQNVSALPSVVRASAGAKRKRHDDYGLYLRDRQSRLEEYEYRVQQHLDAWSQRIGSHALIPERVESGIRALVEEEFLEEVNQWAQDHPDAPRMK